MRTLEGRTALVTGAGRGLGRAIATELARQGAVLFVNDLTEDALAGTVEEIDSDGGTAHPIAADIGAEESVADLFAAVDASSRGLDILINNAGVIRNQTIFETSLEDWDAVMRVNLTGTFLCAGEAMRRMREGGFGRIVQISSIVAHRGALHGHVHYGATKSGLLGFTKSLARTAAPYGITVNAVAPGLIGTDLLYTTHGTAEVDRLCEDIPLGLGRPEDVALAVAFLCGPGGRYITGATLDVNGGMLMR